MAGTPINWQLSCSRQWRKLSRAADDSGTHSKDWVTRCVSSRNQFDRRQINWQRSVSPTACTVHRDCLGRELTYRSRQSCNFRITRGLRIRENFVPWRRTVVIELPSSRRKSCADRLARLYCAIFGWRRWRSMGYRNTCVCVSNFGLWLFRYLGWYVDNMWMVYWLWE